ncbi:polysaccharide biosynthesis/export family protein [Cytophagaceae bacterium ABcell3]|nr:polysaccharide biosynthesis/export family protein [Cytophagaceae bacterium ABcell3]
MFRTEHEYIIDSLRKDIQTDKNYIIQQNDYLTIQVYSNKGEHIVDPTSELFNNQNQNRDRNKNLPSYLVRTNGYVKCPMVGDVYLEGYSLNQADSILEIEYGKFYQDVFVSTKLINKRVIVLGPMGGKLIPLENENINLIEVIAMYGGIQENGKAYNIKIIRGPLNNPDVQIVDLSSIEGMRKASLDMRPNDIVYIEPVRRVFIETARDISPFVGILTSILTLIIIFNNSRG